MSPPQPSVLSFTRSLETATWRSEWTSVLSMCVTQSAVRSSWTEWRQTTTPTLPLRRRAVSSVIYMEFYEGLLNDLLQNVSTWGASLLCPEKPAPSQQLTTLLRPWPPFPTRQPSRWPVLTISPLVHLPQHARLNICFTLCSCMHMSFHSSDDNKIRALRSLRAPGTLEIFIRNARDRKKGIKKQLQSGKEPMEYIKIGQLTIDVSVGCKYHVQPA